MKDAIETLRRHGVQPTPQRLAVAEFVLKTEAHPTADEVLANVRRKYPTVSRATVYNTLNLFVKKHLLCTQILRGGNIVFDPNTAAHHHFIDEETGRVYDVPWDALQVKGDQALKGYEVREYQVIMRGRRKKRR
jgi:Fe2+ or Zn2+ uptake regulation protein